MDIVTGANGGIGREICLGLAKRGHRVVMACRNLKTAETVRQTLIRESGNSCVELWHLDLASLNSVRAFAEKLLSDGDRLDLLCNNAGIMCRDFSLTTDGYETMTQVNYLAPYLLTRLLLGSMVKGSAVVNTASCTYRLGKIGDDFFLSDERTYSLFRKYGNSKLAILLFTVELAARCRGMGITVNAVDPGVVNTGIITMHRWFDPLADVFFRPFIRSASKGAQTSLFLADNASDSKSSGFFWKDSHQINLPAIARNASVRKQFWDLTELQLKAYL